MNRILAVSTLSLALLSGTALAQINLGTSTDGGLSIGITGPDGQSVGVDANAGIDADASGDDGDGALGIGAGAGVGVAASDGDGNDLEVGAGADVGVAASSTDGDGSLNVDGGADADIAASSEDGDNLDVGAEADANAAASVETDEDEIDASTTAAIDSSSRIGIALDGIGDAADAFFVDGARAQLVADAEFRAAFDALPMEQQEELRTACSDNPEGGAFCAAVMAM